MKLAFVTNYISLFCLEAYLDKRKLSRRSVVLVTLRELSGVGDGYAYVLRYPRKASLSILGQCVFGPFYFRAFLKIRALRGDLDEVFLPNVDNLLCNYVIELAKRQRDIKVHVVAEGFMNYQDIGLKDRARWRWWVKIIVGFFFLFRYRLPRGHLSGAFYPQVDSVLAFREEGLKAPDGLVDLQVLRGGARGSGTRRIGVLYLETSLWQWMTRNDWRVFAEAFSDYLNSFGEKIYIKEHPNYPPCGYLRSRLNEYEVLGDERPFEIMFASVEPSVVVSHWCTALAMAKMLNPSVHCVDFGVDYYSEKAYGGDRSLEAVLLGADVEVCKYKK